MDTAAFIDHIRGADGYEEQIAHIQYIPSQRAHYGTLEKPLGSLLQARLDAAGISAFYSHQAEAINKSLDGHNVMVATPSASGKTMCYTIPVLQTAIAERSSRALYLFPTKALAQDQLRTLKRLACPDILPYGQCATFDGDTPTGERGEIKKNARIVLSNPDMLHMGILPNHKSWSRFFSGLSYVVVDEAHSYRGVFGSHVSNVLRRLRRICAYYGSKPRFICCSATIANPGEHARNLVGEDFATVSSDGAPHGSKAFIFWNPPLLNREHSARRSANSEASYLFSELIKQEIRTLVFTRTRKLTELVYMYTRDRLSPTLAARIKPYRAGYMAEDRRQIERELFEGHLLGVVSTTALELGIDVGSLEATVLSGYPGSISSTWQQAGRSGRSTDKALSVLIGLDNPLDQYFMNNPDSFFGKAFENALVNPSNPHILTSHLLCAAWEQPLRKADGELFGPDYAVMVEELEGEGLLRQQKGRWFLPPRIVHPAQQVNIRSASANDYAVIDVSSGYEMLETVEAANAFFQIHEGAIYLHQGEAYHISELDLQRRIALAGPAKVQYYTQARELTDLSIMETQQQKDYSGAGVYFGEVDVTNTVIGYRKKMQYTEEIVGDEPLDLPPQRFVTEALWFDIPQRAIDRISEGGLDLAGGLHAAEHAAISLLPLFALCDRNDIGGVSTICQAETGRPQVFIYDAYPGGIGIAEKGFQIADLLWAATLKAIEECPCLDGCPSCIQSPKCGNNNEPLDKKAAVLILRELVTLAASS